MAKKKFFISIVACGLFGVLFFQLRGMRKFAIEKPAELERFLTHWLGGTEEVYGEEQPVKGLSETIGEEIDEANTLLKNIDNVEISERLKLLKEKEVSLKRLMSNVKVIHQKIRSILLAAKSVPEVGIDEDEDVQIKKSKDAEQKGIDLRERLMEALKKYRLKHLDVLTGVLESEKQKVQQGKFDFIFSPVDLAYQENWLGILSKELGGALKREREDAHKENLKKYLKKTKSGMEKVLAVRESLMEAAKKKLEELKEASKKTNPNESAGKVLMRQLEIIKDYGGPLVLWMKEDQDGKKSYLLALEKRIKKTGDTASSQMLEKAAVGKDYGKLWKAIGSLDQAYKKLGSKEGFGLSSLEKKLEKRLKLHEVQKSLESLSKKADSLGDKDSVERKKEIDLLREKLRPQEQVLESINLLREGDFIINWSDRLKHNLTGIKSTLDFYEEKSIDLEDLEMGKEEKKEEPEQRVDIEEIEVRD